MEKQNSTLKLNDADLEMVPRPSARLVKPIAIVLGLAALAGFIVLMARSGSPPPAPLAVVAPPEPVRTEPAATPADKPVAPPAAPVAGKLAKQDPVIAAAIEAPHDEAVEPAEHKTLTPAEHLRLARKLEREAAQNRRVAAAEYRKEAARYRRIASADRRKSAGNARLALRFQRLAQRSVRRGA